MIGVTLRGPVSAKANATVTMTDAADAISGENLIIDQSSRSVQTTSTRDNLPLTYTLYKVGTNGNIDMQSDSISLSAADSVAGDGSSFENLLLLEGQLQTDDGTFPAGTAAPDIDLTMPSIVEGSVSLSSVDGWYTEIDNIWFASAARKYFN